MTETTNDPGSFLASLTEEKMNGVSIAAGKDIEPMFNPVDFVTTKHHLALLLRLSLFERGFTNDTFYQLHKKYAADTYMSTDETNWTRNNFRRSLDAKTTTWNFIEKFMTVMGIVIVDMEWTLVSRDGVMTRHRLSDIGKYLHNNKPTAALPQPTYIDELGNIIAPDSLGPLEKIKLVRGAREQS